MSNATEELDDFLGHTHRERGSSLSRLKGWKKRDDRAVNVCLHTRAAPVKLWQHGIARVVTLENDGEKRREAWGDTWNCREPEVILKRQYFRDNKTGERENPPTICPLDILLEWVRRMVAAGQLPFCEPLFKWVGDDPDKARIITAAGIFNGYGARELTRDQQRAMRKAGISKKNAWKENVYAKCNYVFTVVDVDNPGDGIQVATETTLLGDKVKELIRDVKVALGDDEGNPLLHPYVIRFEHRPDEQEFGKKYKALRMERIAVTDEVLRLITDEDPPDRSGILKPGNVRMLRADLESHALVDFPWDDIFGPAEQALGIDRDAEAADVADEDIDDDEFDVDRPAAPSVKGSDAGDDADDSADDEGDEDEEGVECNVCKHVMDESEFTCPNCGTEYDEETGGIVKRGKVPRKKRTAKKKAATRKAQPPPPSSAASSRGGDAGVFDDDDEIPF